MLKHTHVTRQGPLTPEHVLLIPIKHVAGMARLSGEEWDEFERYKAALRECVLLVVSCLSQWGWFVVVCFALFLPWELLGVWRDGFGFAWLFVLCWGSCAVCPSPPPTHPRTPSPNRMYAAKGLRLVLFERRLETRGAKHTHVQVIPVPEDKAADVRAAFEVSKKEGGVTSWRLWFW